MDSADAVIQTADTKPSILQQLRARPLVPLIIAVAAAVALLVGLLLWAMEPGYGTLYSGLSDADGGEIIAQLEQMQVPYHLAANGSAILVPSTAIDRTRLRLASQGLPHGAGVGFEIMNNQPFGISQFAEHINYVRALQGELARSIETLKAVVGARVHLAIPEPSVFVREETAPSASVVLRLYHGRSLSEGQVQAIAHLVSSSVPHLTVDHITVIDAAGDLLSDHGDGNGIDGKQLEYVAQIERNYRQRIEAILAPVVGQDNVRARVVADVDFSVGERTEQVYTPNQGDTAVLSKQVNSSRQGANALVGGVPGALSNRPAADLPSPIANPPGPNQGASQAAGGADGSASHSATINYQVNEVIRHVQKETGTVAQVSAAVVIDYGMQSGKDGTMQPVALSDERMQQIEQLVKQAIGFSSARGDSVTVVNVPFQKPPTPVQISAPPWWQSPQIIALAKTIGQWLLIALVALLLWRKLLRPLLQQALPTVGSAQLALADGPDVLAADTDGAPASRQQRLERKKQHAELLSSTQALAKNDPQLVATVLKNWMNNND